MELIEACKFVRLASTECGLCKHSSFAPGNFLGTAAELVKQNFSLLEIGTVCTKCKAWIKVPELKLLFKI